MRASGLGSASTVPPRRLPLSSNQPSGWSDGAYHQYDCWVLPSPIEANNRRVVPSVVWPLIISTLGPCGPKPENAWATSLKLERLEPPGMVLKADVLLALTSDTDPGITACRALATGAPGLTPGRYLSSSPTTGAAGAAGMAAGAVVPAAVVLVAGAAVAAASAALCSASH